MNDLMEVPDGYHPTMHLRWAREYIRSGPKLTECKHLEQRWDSIYEDETPKWRQIPIVDIE